MLQENRSGKVAGHFFGQPVHTARFVAKVNARFGSLARVAVGPERVEIGVRIDRVSGIGMVAFTVLSELFGQVPAADLPATGIAAEEGHVAAVGNILFEVVPHRC